jgi:hypothetical protein
MPAPRKVSTTVGRVRPLRWPWWIRANIRDDVSVGRAVLSRPGNEQFAGAPHRGDPPTGDVSDGMVWDARVVARAATMDCASTSESQPPQRRVVVRDPLLPAPFGGWFPSADAGH